MRNLNNFFKAIIFIFLVVFLPTIPIVYYFAHEGGSVSNRPEWLRVYFLTTQFIPLSAISILLILQFALSSSAIKSKLFINLLPLLTLLFVTSFIIEIAIYRLHFFGV